MLHKEMSRKVLVQFCLCGFLCKDFAALCGPCAYVLVPFSCAWSCVMWDGLRSVAPEITTQALVSKSLCVSLCVPCACIVHSLWMPRSKWMAWTTACLRPRAVLVRSLCRFLVQNHFGSLCSTHPIVHKETGFPCAVLVRIFFRWNFLSLQHSIIIQICI